MPPAVPPRARPSGQPTRRLPRPHLAAVLLVLLLPVAIGGGCSPKPTPTAAPQPASPDAGPFRLATVESRRLDRAIEVTGSLLPIDQTPVSLQVAGRLDAITVDLGSVVRQGDPLARIDASDYELKLRQAKAALGQARARVGLPLDGEDDAVDLERSSAVTQARAVLDEALANRDRIDALSRQGILSTSELETASATYKVAQSRHADALEEARIRVAQLQQRRAEFEIARQQLAHTVIRAPFDGAVQERRANVGEYLSVGDPVVLVVRVDPLRLRVEVSERDAVRVKVGQVVHVTIEGDPQTYHGEVKRLSPAIASGSRTLIVEADVPSLGRLRPGSFARARLITQPDTEALVVPPEAVVTFAGIEKVFTVSAGQAAERRIVTGDRGPGWVEIASGLAAGETVVLAPGSLQAGQTVRAATATAVAATNAPVPVPVPIPPASPASRS
jgi:RND family efflux transporter MFP subunit